jgi:hypothetical protein
MEHGVSAQEVSVWSTGFRKTFRQVGVTEGPVFEPLIEADKARSDARHERLSEATPSISAPMFWFMIAALALLLFGYALVIPRRGGRAQLVGVLLLAGLFMGSLVLIRDVDRPFTGMVAVEPTELVDTRDDITGDFAEAHGAENIPCNEQGDPNPVPAHGP